MTRNSESGGITVTRALVELKTLEKRIHKAISECDVVKVRRKEDKWDVQEYGRQAQSSYQSACDLIARRDNLKARVLDSNGRTKVKIGTQEYTVAEVIDRKSSIEYQRSLLDKLRRQKNEAQALHDLRAEELRQKLDRLLEVNLGKERNSDSIAAITKSFYDTNKVEVVDPLNTGAKIKELDDYITEFEKEADLVLSESNARTLLEF